MADVRGGPAQSSELWLRTHIYGVAARSPHHGGDLLKVNRTHIYGALAKESIPRWGSTQGDQDSYLWDSSQGVHTKVGIYSRWTVTKSTPNTTRWWSTPGTPFWLSTSGIHCDEDLLKVLPSWDLFQVLPSRDLLLALHVGDLLQVHHDGDLCYRYTRMKVYSISTKKGSPPCWLSTKGTPCSPLWGTTLQAQLWQSNLLHHGWEGSTSGTVN